MDIQTAFDIIVEGAEKQRKKSKREGADGCVYRGDNNLKCFVGMLIPDEDYDPDMDNGIYMTVSKVIRRFPHVAEKLGFNANEEMINFLSAMQIIHDIYSPKEWPSKLIEIAKRFRLNTSPILAEWYVELNPNALIVPDIIESWKKEIDNAS